MATGTAAFVATQLARAMAPLADAVSSPGRFRAFLLRMGWQVDDLPPAYQELGTAVASLVNAVDTLDDDPSPTDIAELLDVLVGLYEAVDGLSVAPSGVDAQSFLAEFADRLFELLIVDYLALALPAFYAVAEALGVVSRERHPATPGRPSYVRNRLRLEAFGEILQDPALLPERVYGWGTTDLRFGRIARHGSEFLQAVGINGVAITSLDHTAAVAYSGGDPLLLDQLDEADENVALRISIFQTVVGDTELEIGFQVSELRAPPGTPGPAGLLVEPLVPAELAAIVPPSGNDLEFPLGSRVLLRVRAGSDVSQRFGLVVKPGDVGVQYPFDEGVTLPPQGFGVSFVYQPDPAHVLLGSPTGSRLEARKATAGLTLGTDADGEFEAVGTIAADDVGATIATADLDGFVGDVVGGRDIVVPLKVTVAWSSSSGLRFNGGAGFEVAVDAHLSAGSVRIDEIRAALAATVGSDEAPGLTARTTLGLSGALGPIAFAVSGIGVQAQLAFQPGNAGPMDVDLGFVPPSGAGLKIDGGVISGGGFLKRDPADGSYSGALQLRIGDIEVTATGVLTTHLPDGSPGYSLLISISSKFAPIQLGYGVTLRGVGGLIGVHRTVNTDGLRKALASGSAAGVMFPADPVRDANQILAGLNAMFPAARGRFVFGPMARLAWGIPTPLVTADVGLFIEVPHPIRMFLLGQLTSLLPTPDEALVEIHIDVLGVLDFSKGELAVDASLRDSRLTTFPMTGDMALRARWRNDPVFAAALGGLHPRFPAPAGFPTLRRLQIALGKGDNPRLDLQAYLAVTSNTVQVGAALELYAEAGGLNVSGHLGFDALFHLVPFSFEADASAKVALRQRSTDICVLSLDLTLSGPQPWRAKGTGSFHVLFFSISFHFDVSWGGAGPLGLPVVDPWPLLQAALADARSWAGVLGGGADTGVRLVPAETEDATPRVPPAAALEVRQKVLPLGRTISRFGGGTPPGPSSYTITGLSINGTGHDDRDDVTDYFAPAQYAALSDDEALSRPSFEPMPAGVQVGGAAVEADEAIVSEVKYETILLDVAMPGRRRFDDRISGVLADSFLSLSSAARAPMRTRGLGQFADRAVAEALVVDDERYVLAGVADLVARTDLMPDGPAAGASAARDVLAAHLAEHPGDTGLLQVLPASEVVV